MNIAHIKSKAAAGGQVRGSSRVRRLLACALIGYAAMSSAHAGWNDRDQRSDPQQRQEYNREADQRQQQQQRQYEDRQRQNDERAYQARADDQRRQQEQGNEGRRSGRMTADERRDLRRQINEAGADIYPNQGRRR